MEISEGQIVEIPKGSVFEDLSMWDAEFGRPYGEVGRRTVGVVEFIYPIDGTFTIQGTKRMFFADDARVIDERDHRFYADSYRAGRCAWRGHGNAIYATKADCACGEVFDDGNIGYTTAEAKAEWRRHIKDIANNA